MTGTCKPLSLGHLPGLLHQLGGQDLRVVEGLGGLHSIAQQLVGAEQLPQGLGELQEEHGRQRHGAAVDALAEGQLAGAQVLGHCRVCKGWTSPVHISTTLCVSPCPHTHLQPAPRCAYLAQGLTFNLLHQLFTPPLFFLALFHSPSSSSYYNMNNISNNMNNISNTDATETEHTPNCLLMSQSCLRAITSISLPTLDGRPHSLQAGTH